MFICVMNLYVRVMVPLFGKLSIREFTVRSFVTIHHVKSDGFTLIQSPNIYEMEM